MKITPELLKKYHKGLCSPSEKKYVDQWLAGETAENDVTGFDSYTEEAETEAEIWAEITTHTNIESGKKTFSLKDYASIISKIAACLILISCLAYFTYNYFNRDTSGDIGYKTVSTTKGEKITLTLTDGSSVYLNSDSELRFPENFPDNSRTVYLRGEAFFKVAKDSLKPFIVNTEHTQTQVLGTAFNIHSYSASEPTIIVVAEGKVKFSQSSKTDNHVMLTANMRGVYQEGHNLIQEHVLASKYISWKENSLIFNDQNLSEIAVMLERWYDITVQIKRPELENFKFTGQYDNPSLPDLVKEMSMVMKFEYKLENKTLTIY